jgi:predicted glycoside hydrolase/deacetylase ChbG (UPF0249 family)
MGMTQGSLVAFKKAFKEGILTCASILATAPWFEGAAELYKRNPKWCVGLHLSIIGEWRGYRWRPVLPWDQVPSVVDPDGFLYRYPEELFSNKPKIEEIEDEFRAQLKLALKKGINVAYLDTHYLGYSSYPGIEEVFNKLAREYNIPISGKIGESRFRGVYTTPVSRKKEIAIKRLEELSKGLWLWVTHPGIESPEQNALVHTHPDHVFHGGGVGKHRAAELDVIMSKEVKSLIREKNIKLTNYIELWEAQNKK